MLHFFPNEPYVEEIAGTAYEEFVRTCQETPQAETILPRFIESIFG